MTLVTASSTARASRSAVPAEKPADSAIFFVISRTTPRNDVWLGIDSRRLALTERGAGAAPSPTFDRRGARRATGLSTPPLPRSGSW